MGRVSRIALACALAASLAACGDDDEEESGLTRAQYVTKADAVCTRVDGELDEHFEEGFPVVQSQVPEFVADIAPTVTKGMDDLAAIEPPEADADELAGFRKAARDVGARWDKAATDAEEAGRIFQDEGGFEPLRTEAEGAGMKACAAFDEDEEGDDAAEGEAEEAPDPATFSPEKRAYIERVDAVCKSLDAEDDKVDEEVFGAGFPPSMEAWAAGLPRFADIGRRRVAELKDVPPPAADKATMDAIVAEHEEIVTGLDEAARVAAAGDEQELIPLLQRLFPQFDELDAELRQFGFQVCGSEDADEE